MLHMKYLSQLNEAVAQLISRPEVHSLIDDLKQQLHRLPKGKEYVAYCRGPYCVYADRAVELLRSRGRRARRLRDGFPEWRAAGLPVASGVQPGAFRISAA